MKSNDNLCLQRGITCSLLLLLSVCSIHCRANSSCTQEEVSTAYLDIAMDMITRAKHNIISNFDCKLCPNDCPECVKDCPECLIEYPECPKDCAECTKDCPVCPMHLEYSKINAADCADVLNMGNNKSGVYDIWPMNRMMEGNSVTVFCDMEFDGGGWTVIQRRGDFKSPRDYFYKDWKSYKEGFGRKEKDFWLGNDNIFALTNQKCYSVRFDLMDVEGNRKYAIYDTFWIDNEDCNYTLHISGYRGDAGDAMRYSNNHAFSAKDRDNDGYDYGNCVEKNKGGWWYDTCALANLNGLYRKGKHKGEWDGVYWYPWKGYNESLEWTEIKIRPKHFRS